LKISKFSLSILAIIVAVLVWGSAFAVVKVTLRYAPPFTLLVLRFLIALMVIYPFAYREGFRLSMTIKTGLFPLGLTGIALSYGLSNIGLLYSTSGNAVLIYAVSPVVTGLLSIIFLKEKVTFQIMAGVLVSIVGVYIATNIADNAGAPHVALGNLLLLASMVVYSVYTILVKKKIDTYSSQLLTAVSFSVGLLFFIPIAAGEIAVKGLPSFPFTGFLAVIYLGVIATALAFFLWNYGLREVNATIASVLMNLMPVVGLVASYFLGEPVGWRQIIGAIVVVAGVMLCTLQKQASPAR
jgi:drug/metabolite transporter (DMT)-like permease